ncbi:DUF4349 domain-containing protein [Actinoallomurus iriomotensis]|uniref:DUF4349 domain-containing protein n=1 Tax=Actinoallomurus iriomotensis TaxID=478107 RepID=A0A9W6SEG0_9ACTN|nr:DUF4349 domain-containing protein [Actinoallomurus iriomotensis]GLY90717.1 hypothetical protein Airi02_086460 [Actinoallomurus iriomotensis]
MRPFIVVSAAALVLLTACSGADNGASAGSGGRAAVARAPSKEADAASRAQNVRLAPAQAIVYTADLTMRSGDVTGAAGRAKSVVAAAGGYVGNENATENPGSRPSATITFKIPSARYQGVLDQLASSLIGTRVSLRQQADDVTQEVADVDSRVKSAKATLASFRKLLDKASDVDDIVQLEQEIASRESDLESLQARQKSLASQTSYATVTLRLEGTTPTRREHHRSTGFSGGVSSGWHAFTVFVKGLALVVGWLLPFAGLAALIGLPAWWLWRRRRRSSGSSAA